MDRSKFVGKRPIKGKVHTPPGDFIALGSKSDPKSTSLPPRKPLPQLKRDTTSLAGCSLVTKKPKLLPSFTPLGRPTDTDKRGSPTTQVHLYEELAAEVDPSSFLAAVNKAEDNNDDEKIEALLCGTVKYLKMNRAKPDPALFLSLMYLAKTRPTFFGSEVVIEAFCSLLKRDLSTNFKAKGNAIVPVLTCNVLMIAFQDEENWPDNFVKVLLDDSLGERVWVDRADCKTFKENIQSAFSTKIPRQFTTTADLLKTDSLSLFTGTSPSQTSTFGEDEEKSSESIADVHSKSSTPSDDFSSMVFPRYTCQQVSIESHVLEVLRDQLSRRQSIDGGSRNLLRLMSVACGYSEVRTMATQRLEMWLQNPKLTRNAQELLMSVCMNCDQHSQQDVEVMSQISKIRLKTKVLINHYLLCIRELLSQHPENLKTLMTHTIYNELSNSRNPNNMSLLSAMFNHASASSAKMLAEIFQDLLCNRDDYVRALRALLREIVRAARHDLNFTEFALGLMKERSEPKFKAMEPQLKERLMASIADLITLTSLLCVSPAIREAASAATRGERRDIELLRSFQHQIAVIQRDSVWWLHTVAPKMFDCSTPDYVYCVRKVLFVEKPEQYSKLDNWPSEADRGMLLHLVCSVPVLEDTLMRVLLMGLMRELAVTAADSLELAEQLICRAAMLYDGDYSVLRIEKLELINAVLNLCAYHHPDNIVLPMGYEPPVLAISNLYWKAWLMLLIVATYNIPTFGLAAWSNYPTLKCFMEMVMTNNYKFPPPTMGTREKPIEDVKNKEKQTSKLERHEILEFEGHLAAGTSKVQITESNSLLLCQLITMNPSGAARKPPPAVLEQLETLNQNLHLGNKLCRSRNPDFLLNIIQRQGTSQSMPWLAELVESSDSSLDVLPVQCLCEFLLHEPDGGTVQESEDETKADKFKRKQKQRKQEQLLGRLQALLYSNLPEDTRTISEVLGYFVKRLSSTQSSSRQLALKGLAMVLSQSHIEGSDDMETDAVICNDPAARLIPSHKWLLEQLPALPQFNSVKVKVCSALRQACQIETDAAAVSASIIFLSRHTQTLPLQELDELALDMSKMIVERTTLVNYLLLQEGTNLPVAEMVLNAMIELFNNYLDSAQQPRSEAYSWSDSQDQILLQWESGKSATINVLVVHAMIILLTYGTSDSSNGFDKLLETWFPLDGHPPSAFLVDTSEEALLLPDWLKLRMIRCSVDRLVDIALQDLEPSQLLLFVQSFGIPIASMSKLLQLLDRASDAHNDEEGTRSLVVDRGYMAQLVEIQHLRGADGGETFHASLLDSPRASDQNMAAMPVDMVPVLTAKRRLSRMSCVTDLSTMSCQDIQVIKNDLMKMYPGSTASLMTHHRQLLCSLQKAIAKDKAVVGRIVTALTQLISVDEVFRSSFIHHLHLSCPLIRAVIIAAKPPLETELVPLMTLLQHHLKDSQSALAVLVGNFCKKLHGKQVKAYGRGAASGDDRLNLQQVLLDGCERDEAERLLASSVADSIRCGTAQITTQQICEMLTQLNNSPRPASLTGLLIDWLELLDPEMISSCAQIQQQLLFSCGDQRRSFERSRRSSEAYLLALLTHQASWTSIQCCVNVLVAGDGAERLDSTSVLDFLTACFHIPALWQGREKKIPKNYTPEDVLALQPDHVVRVVDYMLREGREMSSRGQQESAVRSRLPLLLRCCCSRRSLVSPVVSHLMKGSSQRNTGAEAVLCDTLIRQLYMQLPQLVGGFVSDHAWLSRDLGSTQLTNSQLDVITHQLLTALGNANQGKTAENKMYDANIACRKLASEHPLLLLRQLPVMSALLQGRAQFTYRELKHRNHLLLYVHLLGVIQLLQPHIFNPQYSEPFTHIISAYFELIKLHGLYNKQLASVVNKFVKMLHGLLSHDPAMANQNLHEYVPLLNELTQQYPDLAVLRSLLAGLTLPGQKSEESAGPAVPVTLNLAHSTPPLLTAGQPVSSWSASQLAPFLQKIAIGSQEQDVLEVLKDLDETSKRNVDILQHFLSELRRLMLNANEMIRPVAHTLIMRHIRHDPTCASQFVAVFLQCLDHKNPEVVRTALMNLAEFVLLAQGDAKVLLQKAFCVGVSSKLDTGTFICDAIQLLNTETIM